MYVSGYDMGKYQILTNVHFNLLNVFFFFQMSWKLHTVWNMTRSNVAAILCLCKLGISLLRRFLRTFSVSSNGPYKIYCSEQIFCYKLKFIVPLPKKSYISQPRCTENYKLYFPKRWLLHLLWITYWTPHIFWHQHQSDIIHWTSYESRFALRDPQLWHFS